MRFWSPAKDHIPMKYGAGGGAMRTLIKNIFLENALPARPGTIGLEAMDDGAAIPFGDRWLVMTTDSHVIHPLFFPGGDIGRLAISGTVNDLAMMGATEVLGLTCAVIIEEGLPFSTLEKVQASIAATCREAGAPIITGDTKVMGHGELDALVINTTGLGVTDRVVRDNGLRPGDRIIVTGTMGDHGMAVMSARRDLGLAAELRSDVAPLGDLVRIILRAGGEGVVALKDPTRGGLASALSEMAEKSDTGVLLDETAVPITDAVRAASDLLGIDPLHVANEGKAVIGVRPDVAAAVLDAIRAHPLGRDAALVGTAIAEHKGSVILDTGVGRRLLVELDGEPLPRIC